MKYIKLFETTAAFESARATLDLPNVSLTENDMDVHYLPYVAPVTPTYDYVEIGGIKWATKNIGANSVTDAGLYFQWGDVRGYTASQLSGACHSNAFSLADYNMAKYGSFDGLVTLESSDDAATANMGVTWHMPTVADFNKLLSATTNAWVTNYKGSGVNGRLFTSKTDSSKVLFFPAAGYCYRGSVGSVGTCGYYWSSSLNTSNVISGRFLYFSSGDCDMSDNLRFLGFSVRGVAV